MALDLLEAGDEDGYMEIRYEAESEAWADHGESELWGAFWEIVGERSDGDLADLRARSAAVHSICEAFEREARMGGWIEFEFTQSSSSWSVHAGAEFRAAVIRVAGELRDALAVEFCKCVLNGAMGIYLPQDWAQWHKGSEEARARFLEELPVLCDGPETEKGDYWEAWETVSGSCWFYDRGFELGESGDLFQWDSAEAQSLAAALDNCPHK